MSFNALFASSNSRSQQKHLVEFKAGKMTMKGTMVHPDKRKGMLYVYQSDDALMHFCWKDRQSGTVEDDLIIFPDDVEFKRVNECTTGRVYLLKFKTSSRKFFFWLQESKTDKDEENCRRINEVLNNPPSVNSRNSSGTPDGELQSLLNNMSQQQLMQLFGNVGQIGGLSNLLGTINRPSSSSTRSTSGSTGSSKPSSGSSTTSGSKSSSKTTSSPAGNAEKSSNSGTPNAAIQLSDLQNFLSGINVPKTESNASQQVDLSTALTSETLQSILKNPEAVKELQKYLPAEDADGNQEDNLKNTISCPQFQQALRTFSAALQSGQLGPLVQQFEVGSDAVSAANQGNMEEFVKALQNARIDGSESKPAEKRKTSDDEGTDAKKKDNKEDKVDE